MRIFILLSVAVFTAAGQTGYPSRDPKLDVLPGFRQPPAGYGEVGFYWWLGDPLTRERLTWELDQLAGSGVSALQVNYAHDDKGGQSYGLTMHSDPPLFSEPWWDLFGWFLKQARARGMATAVSDYTLGLAGQGAFIDDILRQHPDVHGAMLAADTRACRGGESCRWKTQGETLSVAAYRAADATRVNLTGKTEWTPPAGEWQVTAVYVVEKPNSMDPMNPLSGKGVIETFFQRFEDRNPGESGKGLNFFFSDELQFGVKGKLWNARFAAEFARRKGYDIVPELPALFMDMGPRTPKFRLDYSDVMVALSEENYFKPVYDWHHSRGMLYGCDHGGRGRQVNEFGDYFRTQKWLTAPGNDQPGLKSDIIKNKVASSITHLYERQRTWLEGYYGSGWGTSSAMVADATFRNYAMGQNLLTLHGLYYSTHGGWWEWAPPENHFRMPYWPHMREFLRATERMSYLLSQGRHRADVAIVYPVAAVEAGMEADMQGQESVKTAFALGEELYKRGIDFDFIDFESLARTQVEDKKLKVAGEEYRVLVLPRMLAVRHSTLEKALEFARAGGSAVALGAAPVASDKVGRDADLARALRVVQSVDDVERLASPRDFSCAASVLHRRVGDRDIYFVYGAEKGTACEFRASGKVELWDPWTGKTAPLGVAAQTGGVTRIHMPLGKNEPQLIVFSPGSAVVERQAAALETVKVEGPWQFELLPTLDNRFGDYRQPPSHGKLGPEVRRINGKTYGYGPRFWKLGPLPAGDTSVLEAKLLAMRTPESVEFAGRRYDWQPYEFSWRWGIENDPGHQGYHGLKKQVSDDFIALGKQRVAATTTVYETEPGGSRYYLWTSVTAERDGDARVASGGLEPANAWVNGTSAGKTVRVRRGGNPLLLRYDKAGRGHYLLEEATAPAEWKQTYPLSMTWFGKPGVLPFDTQPGNAAPSEEYRFTAPPGLRAFTVPSKGRVEAWAEGQPLRASGNRFMVPGHAREIRLKVAQRRGDYGGAAFDEPIALECGGGDITLTDWSTIDSLASYSGGAWYRKSITLTAAEARRGVALDLGDVVASAEVRINGKTAGVRVAPPWRFDAAGLLRAGENRIEVLVYNTLANHYQTIPTRYRGKPTSGLLGPVTLILR